MENIIVHEHFIPINGIKQKIIYHISDLHLTEYDALSDAAETEGAKKMTVEWENLRRNFSVSHGEPYGKPQMLSPKKHFENLINLAESGDALVFTGDIFDCLSGANIRLANKLLTSFPLPLLAVCGNHENPGEMPNDCVFSKIHNNIQTLDLGDIAVIGINNSNRIITKEQCNAVKEMLMGNKPVIIAMHIPFMTDDTRDIFMNIGDGFRINYDGCPAENLEMLNIIRNNPDNCAAVIAGHLHFALNGKITADIPQFVASQAITGHINKYIIGE